MHSILVTFKPLCQLLSSVDFEVCAFVVAQLHKFSQIKHSIPDSLQIDYWII